MKNSSISKRLVAYAGNYRYFTIASWFLSALSAWIMLLPFVYIWGIIQEVIRVAPHFSQLQHSIENAWMAVLFAVIGELLYVLALLCSHVGAFRIARNLRMAMIAHIATLPVGVIDQIGSGKARKIMDEAAAATETYLAHQLPDKAGAIATPVGLACIVLYFDWRLGILSILPIAIAFLIMRLMSGTRLQKKMAHFQNAMDDMSNEAVEYVRGIPVVKTFGQSIHTFTKFKKAIRTYERWVTSYCGDMMLPMTLYTTITNGIFVFLILGAMLLTHHGVSSNVLLSLIFYSIVTPVITITLARVMLMSENVQVVGDAMQRMDRILQKHAYPLVQPTKHPRDGSITFRHVCYCYKKEHAAINDVSFHIEAGRFVAFVGPSGGGKTTIANLITRFIDTAQGEILIGGIPCKQISKTELMNMFSIVFQNSRLINDTVYNNVCLGKPDATREEVLQALRDAQCMDIVASLKDGVDTVIKAGGGDVSGGEQQRLVIARAFLKNAPILILDEATAYADLDNEKQIQKALSKLTKGKTVVMIAHRLSTIVYADRIYVLQDGRICEHGNHRSLLQQKGVYCRMWKEYQKSATWKIKKEGARI